MNNSMPTNLKDNLSKFMQEEISEMNLPPSIKYFMSVISNPPKQYQGI
jgi:hypothetical protein